MPKKVTIKQIKQSSLTAILTSMPRVAYIGLVWTLILFITSMLNNELTGMRALNEALTELTKKATTIDPDAFQSVIANYSGNLHPIGPLLSTLLSLLMLVVEAGFMWYTLRVSRGQKSDVKSLFDGFAHFGRLLLLRILQNLALFVGLLFFIAPGIILHYSFSMAVYICYDNPEMSAIKCLQASVTMMKGHKFELFKLHFSFIGWYALELLSANVMYFIYPLISCWVSLFYGVSASAFYNNLIGFVPSPPVVEV